MTEVLPAPTIRVVSVAEQGPPGPPGAAGPGFSSRQGFFGMDAPIPIRKTLVSSQRYPYPISGLYGSSVGTGSLRVTLYINGVPVPGLDHALLTTDRADTLADAPVVLPLGGELELELSDVDGASVLKITIA